MPFTDLEILDEFVSATAARSRWVDSGDATARTTTDAGITHRKRRACARCGAMSDGRQHCNRCRRSINGKRATRRKYAPILQEKRERAILLANLKEQRLIKRYEATMRDTRERLPDTREGITQKFKIISRNDAGTDVIETKGHIQANTYPDGRLAEIFVRIGKSGSSDALLDQWAIAASMSLQHGCPVETLFRKFVGTQYGIGGAVVGMKEVQRCTSVTDLVARFILARFSLPEAQP